jgi:hypothetical protein
MSAALSEIPLPQSVLDTDLYKVMKPPIYSFIPANNLLFLVNDAAIGVALLPQSPSYLSIH